MLSPDDLQALLKRIESGTTTAEDAERLKAHLAALEADNAALLAAAQETASILTERDWQMRQHKAHSILAKLEQPHPGAALLERMQRLKNWARLGLLLYHGNECKMGRGAYPEDPAECEDPECREWAKALEEK